MDLPSLSFIPNEYSIFVLKQSDYLTLLNTSTTIPREQNPKIKLLIFMSDLNYFIFSGRVRDSYEQTKPAKYELLLT